MKIAATAANESWKPGSNKVYGFHASRTSAPRSQKCQRSAGRAASQASETSAPDTPARRTDGCAPTASTYAAIAVSAPICPSQRGMPSSHASASAPPATNTTFWPETASRVFILAYVGQARGAGMKGAVKMDGYVRVSRTGGREGESFISPKLQREGVEAYAKARGWRIDQWHED